MDKKLTTLITGASSGIGREMAILLAAKNTTILLVSRNLDKLDELANFLRLKYKTTVYTRALDLSQRGAASELFEYTQSKGLDIDILVNNAGVGIYEEHVNIDTIPLNKMLQLNIVALAELCQIYGKTMKARGFGKILNIASVAAYQPTPFFAAYGASKSFVLNFSEALAKELEDFGVSVSCLSPGPTDTSFFENIDTEKISGNHQFNNKNRQNAQSVAQIGVSLLFKGGFSEVAGFRNKILVFLNRFASRSFVASVSKKLIQPQK